MLVIKSNSYSDLCADIPCTRLHRFLQLPVAVAASTQQAQIDTSN